MAWAWNRTTISKFSLTKSAKRHVLFEWTLLSTYFIGLFSLFLFSIRISLWILFKTSLNQDYAPFSSFPFRVNVVVVVVVALIFTTATRRRGCKENDRGVILKKPRLKWLRSIVARSKKIKKAKFGIVSSFNKAKSSKKKDGQIMARFSLK